MNEFDLLKELRDGYSAQTKTSNKYWGLLMLASVISVSNYRNTEKLIDLPFSLGKVSQTDFHSFILLLICTLAIAFASAWLQQLRTRNLIQKVIDDIPEDKKYIKKIHIQDLFDSTSLQTFNRVSPIAQVMQGKNQFFGEENPRRGRRFLGATTYLLLKIPTSIIIFLFPLFALYRSARYFSNHNEGTSWNIPIFFYWLIISISTLVFLIMIYYGIKYILKAMRIFFKKK